jgi:hypothetical protein
MTRQTDQLRARYAPMYAVVVVALLALSATGTGQTQASNQSPAMDVSAIMGSIDTGSLPVQGHVDAF